MRGNLRKWIDRILTVIAAAGIALALGLLALWVRSAWVDEGVTLGGPPVREIGSGAGCLYYVKFGGALPASPARWRYGRQVIPGSRWRWAWFEWYRRSIDDDPANDARVVVVPHWFCAAIIGLPAASFLLVRRARRRRRAARLATSICISCGYDLRGGHARCPECGTIVPAAAGAAPPAPAHG
jgi:hypothetical protein